MDDARVTFRLAGVIPYFGRPVRAVQHAVAAGEHEARAAEVLRELAADLLGGDGAGRAGPPVFRRGRVDLELVRSAVPRLESAVSHVRRADREIRAIPSLPFMGFLDRLKAEALDASGRAVTMTEEALVGARLLPSLLGADGGRPYLLVLQDGSRLRATGGTAVAWGVVTATDGRLTEQPEALPGPGGLEALPPELLPPDVAWYVQNVPALRGIAGAGEVNLSPDFPTSAEAWAALAEAASGHSVDGAIAVDAVGLSYLLEGRRVSLSSGQSVSGRGVERVLGDPASPGGQLVAAELLAAAWGTIADPDPLLPTLKQIGRALREKHLQIWSARPADGPLLDSLGWDGSLDVIDATADHLQVALTNLVAEAADPRVEIAYEVTITASGDARATCRVTVTNDSTRLYRGLVALYAPRGAALSAAATDGLPAHQEGGSAAVFLRTVRVPAGKAETVRFDYSSPQVARQPALGLPPADSRPVYRITIQRQASSRPAEVTVRVILPSGATVRSAPGWTVADGTVTLDLTLTRDLVRQIDF